MKIEAWYYYRHLLALSVLVACHDFVCERLGDYSNGIYSDDKDAILSKHETQNVFCKSRPHLLISWLLGTLQAMEFRPKDNWSNLHCYIKDLRYLLPAPNCLEEVENRSHVWQRDTIQLYKTKWKGQYCIQEKISSFKYLSYLSKNTNCVN